MRLLITAGIALAAIAMPFSATALIIDALDSGEDLEKTNWIASFRQYRYASIQGLTPFQSAGEIYHLIGRRSPAYATPIANSLPRCALITDFPVEMDSKYIEELVKQFATALEEVNSAASEYADILLNEAFNSDNKTGNETNLNEKLSRSLASIKAANRTLTDLLSRKNVFLYRWTRGKDNQISVSLGDESLSGILCARHIMKPERSMYAKQDEQEESGGGSAAYPERGH